MNKLIALCFVVFFLSACGGGSSDNTVEIPPIVVNPPPVVVQNCSSPSFVQILWAFDQDEGEANLAIDGSTSSESRWQTSGTGRWILFDLGEAHDIQEVHTAWYLANERTTTFDIQSSLDGSNWTNIELGLKSGATQELIPNIVTNSDARYVRIVANGNTTNDVNALLEAEVYSCGTTGTQTETYTPVTTPSAPLVISSLDPSAAPSENFDLTQWYVSVPTDRDNNGRADSIYEAELNSGYELDGYFYTGDDGGMVFRCPADGFKTSTNTSYPRVELREMLRAGDTSISNQGVNRNNWVFASAPEADRINAGGIDGNMKATLAVNQVTTTGENFQIGRLVIGQIHANSDEPIRLYYRKLPENELGSIYFAHEPLGEDDIYYELIGSRSNDASNPDDGIALNEVFSYEIDVEGNILSVSILREGKPTVTQSISMYTSGYDQGGQYMYFKAGVYHLNNSADSSEYAQATFYGLEVTHP